MSITLFKGFEASGRPTLNLNDLHSNNADTTIDNVVNCIKKLTNNEEYTDCARKIQSETSTRNSKEVKDLDIKDLLSNESVSFILSIEPVEENLSEAETSLNDLEIEPRDPKAVFVMLPNIDPDEPSEARSGRKMIDGFVIDQTVNDEKKDNTIRSDNKDLNTEDGSGAVSVNSP